MFSFRSLPLEGAAERREAGLASFLGGKAASSLPSPCGEGFISGIAPSSYRSPYRNSIPMRTIKPPCGATCIAPQGGLYISTGAIPRHPAGVKGDPC